MDRRTIIEEAAGVLKYKKRKEDSLRKLDNTKDNIEKVDLVIKELMVSLEPLRLESIQAKKYVEYRDELKDIEISLLAKDIKDINDQFVISKDKLKELNEEILKMSNSSSIDSSNIEKLKNKHMTFKKAINTLIDTFVGKDKYEAYINETQDKLMELQETLSNLEMQKQVLSERKKYEVDDQKLQNNILALKESKVELEKNINSFKSNINVLNDEIAKLKKDFENKTTEYNTLIAKRNTLSDTLNKTNRDILILKNKIDVLKSDIEHDVGVPYAAKSIISNPKLNGIHNVLCKLFETSNEYANAINISLGANSNVVVVNDTTSATKAIEFLKQNSLGRLTFFPISVIKGRFVDPDTLSIAENFDGYIDVASNLVQTDALYKNIIDNQLGNILVVKDIETMKALGSKIKYRYRIVTLDGEILHTGGAMTGGNVNTKQSNVINNKLLLEKQTKDLENLQASVKKTEQEYNVTNEDVRIFESELISKRSDISAKDAIIEAKTKELDEMNSRLDSINSEIKGTDNVIKNEVDKELDKVLSDIVKTSKEKEETNNKLIKLRSDRNDVSSEIEELELANKKKNSDWI